MKSDKTLGTAIVSNLLGTAPRQTSVGQVSSSSPSETSDLISSMNAAVREQVMKVMTVRFLGAADSLKGGSTSKAE